MDEKILYQVLDNIGKHNLPETMDVLPGVKARLRKEQSLGRRRLRHPAQVIAGAVAGILFMATTVYAITQWAIHDPAVPSDRVTELNLSQTIGDTTVDLDWAYADANRIVLAYTVSNEDGELAPNLVTDVTLTDRDGRVYPPISAFFADLSVPEMLTGNAHFDASVIDSHPQSLNLQFRVLNKFSFDFTVPFIAGIRIERQPDVEIAGLSANLEWLVITPSMTRAYFCYEAPAARLWSPVVRLSFDGRQVAREPGANYPDFDGLQRRADGRWCRGNIFLTTYAELPKVITLTITQLQTPQRYSQANMQRAAAVLARYGIEAEVVRNEAQTSESYLLSVPNPPDDLDVMEQAWEDAMNSIGDPLEGERIDGPWVLTAKLP